MKNLPIKDIKPNPNNPRKIIPAELDRLVKSIQEFPEMLAKRPIVVDEKLVVLGGNMRLKACKKAGLKEIPVLIAEDWTEDQKKEFIIRDNVSFGFWDFEGTEGWDENDLIGWGVEVELKPDLINQKEITDQEFNEEVAKYDDENAQLPIVPEFHEKHAYFIIATHNEIDEEFVRNIFDLHGKTSSHKKTDNRRSNIIPFEKLQEVCTK